MNKAHILAAIDAFESINGKVDEATCFAEQAMRSGCIGVCDGYKCTLAD